MDAFYSPTTGGFYYPELHGARTMDDGTPNPDCHIPADAVPLTSAQALALVDGQSDGRMIVAGADGIPALQARPPEAHEAAKARALALLRTERAPVLSILDGMQVSAMVNADPATAQLIETLKQGLKNAPDAIPWDSCPDFETMRKAGKAYYASLVKGVPADIRSAFWVTA